jgi:hypothetical protein
MLPIPTVATMIMGLVGGLVPGKKLDRQTDMDRPIRCYLLMLELENA